MNYSRLPGILSILLLSVRLKVSRGYEYQKLALINQLNNFYHFDHNIFLLDSSVDLNCCIGTSLNDTYTPQSVYTFKNGNDNITGFESLKEIQSKNPFLIVVPGRSEFDANIQLFYHIKIIQRLNVRMKIGVFFSNIESIISIERLFNWCWQHRILNILSAFNLIDNELKSTSMMNVYKFDPFGEFELVNVTGRDDFENYFPSQLSNFHLHPIRIPVVGGEIVTYESQLWDIVFEILNATATMIEVSENATVLQAFEDYDLDLLTHLQTVREFLTIYFAIYPMGTDEMVIVVPQAAPFSDFMAYLKRITSDYVFVHLFTTIAVITILLTLSGYFRTTRIKFLQYLADVLNLLMNDNSAINYRQLHRADVCLIVPLTFAGFIIVNGVLSIFQSYVTLPVNQPQINTVDDLYQSSVPIVTPDDIGWASTIIYLLQQTSKHGGWNDKIVRTDLVQINKQVFSFNTSMSFITVKSGAKTLLEAQKRLDIVGYHIPTEMYLLKTFVVYSVNGNFPFIERINEIIHSLRQAGLCDKWTDDRNEVFLNGLLKKHRDGHVKRNSDADDTFPVPTVVIYGWCASAIVFISEIVWEKRNLSKVTGMLYKRLRINNTLKELQE